jgi:hypothetical protein
MPLSFTLVESRDQIREATRVADEIWHDYWPALIGEAQTDYMVDTMQSLAAITNDIRNKGYLYYLLRDEKGTCVGYTAAQPQDITGHADDPAYIEHGAQINRLMPGKRLFISKIYLYADQRGKHYCSRVIEFYENLCRERHLAGMYLTVNRGNELGVRAYLGRGFKTIEEVDADIGQGFVMNDHIMAQLVD